ncbi:hypothetical protein PLESTB_000999500 [Pleodorina starrii]|uniref:Patatin n=1 Tax=Pleodorina starrii TaxID=330485 RepID=A0A9W6BPJ0_9CHLO|nr:hypothetical protein PLESTM_001858500 [Pleodorina starrii]GLC55550.1 hypothetical protein PLESTB_000999500 [Pleodorina starrii]GLC76431.1 hypothetical protein PLESTF_001779800 [Pleodorina starrii]
MYMHHSLGQFTRMRALSGLKTPEGQHVAVSRRPTPTTGRQTNVHPLQKITPPLGFNEQCLSRAGPAPGHRRPVSQPAAAASAASSGASAPRIATDYGFGFSAGGLLFPYFLGVAVQLQAMNVLRPETPVAGASAGSIVAVCTKSGLGEQELLEAFWDLAQDCRRSGTRTRLKSVLQRVLEAALPDDIHERCEGRAFLAVTSLWPQFEPRLVSSFSSREDLINTLLVSSHIPYWFDGSLFTTYRDGLFFDGGITNFIPTTPTERCHRVCCFASQQLRSFKNIDLSPDTYEAWPYDMRTMLSWAFEPAPEETLQLLVEKGKRDARSWAVANVPATELVMV